MAFGPYPVERCFQIEESKIYCAVNKRGGIKVVEFLLLRANNVLCLIEAKSSSPKPGNTVHFDGFISEIREKMVNGFSLGFASCLGRHADDALELSDEFKDLDLSTVGIKFILVIKDHEEPWLVPIKDELERVLRPTLKTWGIGSPAVEVLNEALAVKYKFILPSKS